jgi:4'-phosphopantetheinyl transferase
MIQIFWAYTEKSFSKTKTEEILNTLTSHCSERYYSFKKTEDAHTFLAGRILLLKALKANNYPESAIDNLKYDEYGRISVSKKFDLNISHSNNIAVLAFSETNRVGIDIESISQIEINQFNKFFSPSEIQLINSSDNPNRKFFEFWTSKESVMKLEGKGFSIDPLKIFINDKGNVEFNRKKYFVKEIILDSAYICNIASYIDFNFKLINIIL